MSRRTTRRAQTARRWAVAAAIIVGGSASPAPAEGGAPASVAARWQVAGGEPALTIPLAGVLTAKQRSMLEGGFTTVSELALFANAPSEDDEDAEVKPTPLLTIPCSVKFDAWEETYEVTRFTDPPSTALTREFAGYADPCLTVTLDSAAEIARLAPRGGTLAATLVVKQTSPEEAKKIKDWLVKQQSGVMQGLFSHMLGELTLNQTIVVTVEVVPKPHELGTTPKTPIKAAVKPKTVHKE